LPVNFQPEKQTKRYTKLQKVKNAITLLVPLLAMLMAGCLKEGESDCSAKMTLSFRLQDDYVPGSYDTRIGNDVQLYVFSNDKCVASRLIPYSAIQAGGKYTMQKSRDMDGQLELVAWAVPDAGTVPGIGSVPAIPGCNIGDPPDRMNLRLSLSRAAGDYQSAPTELYLGTDSFQEALLTTSSHEIEMIHAACRVQVNIIDNGSLGGPAADPHVRVLGGMSEMNTRKDGLGVPATVEAALGCPSGDATNYTTGLFGILPSTGGQTVSVEVVNGSTLLATLTVPTDQLPRGAEAGGLLIFEYTLGQAHFTLTIDGNFRLNINIINAI